MDIRYYFDPVDFNNFRHPGPLSFNHTLGAAIEKTTNTFNPQKIRNINTAIIGVPFINSLQKLTVTKTPDNIRKELYRLAKPSAKTGVADFGNLKPSFSLKGNYQALRDIIEFFNELDIVTLIIGGSQDLTIGMCLAHQTIPYFSLTTIDTFLDVKQAREPLGERNYLTRIFNIIPQVFQFNLIGYQGHFVPEEYLSKTKGIKGHFSLGNIRDDISQTEPVFRNSDVVSFDMCSIKLTEAPGSLNGTPNGLNSEEACQLSRFAGLSNRVKTFGLFGFNPDKPDDIGTNQLAAQIAWYFIEAISYRSTDIQNSLADVTSFQVEVSGVENPLIFLKNNTTNQWWMQFENKNRELVYFACSENTYQMATTDEIPGIWMNYLQKIDEM